MDPVLLAHDTVEHWGDFSVEGEAKAHGAIYFGRFHTGYRAARDTRPPTIRDLAYDMDSLYYAVSAEGMCSPGQVERIPEIHEDISEIMAKGLAMIRSNYDDSPSCDILRAHYAGWFRRGYLEAKARFGTPKAITGAFINAEHTFSRITKLDLQEGDRVEVQVNPTTQKVSYEVLRECGGCGRRQDPDEVCENCYAE